MLAYQSSASFRTALRGVSSGNQPIENNYSLLDSRASQQRLSQQRL